MPTLAGKPISQNGLGLMRLTWKDDVTPDEKAFKILKADLAAGVNIWNEADFYGTFSNNSLHLMRRYFIVYSENADKIVLFIKSGITDMRTFEMNESLEDVRNFVNTVLNEKKNRHLRLRARR